jgi:hypothetical protein
MNIGQYGFDVYRRIATTKKGGCTPPPLSVQCPGRVRAYTMATARGSVQCGEATATTSPGRSDTRHAVTPPAALPALGFLEDSNTVHPSLVGATQRIPMRTIGEHEQDTPHILQSHVSSLNTHVFVILFVQFMKPLKFTMLYDYFVYVNRMSTPFIE